MRTNADRPNAAKCNPLSAALRQPNSPLERPKRNIVLSTHATIALSLLFLGSVAFGDQSDARGPDGLIHCLENQPFSTTGILNVENGILPIARRNSLGKRCL